jgi:hypothetical protein
MMATVQVYVLALDSLGRVVKGVQRWGKVQDRDLVAAIQKGLQGDLNTIATDACWEAVNLIGAHGSTEDGLHQLSRDGVVDTFPAPGGP